MEKGTALVQDMIMVRWIYNAYEGNALKSFWFPSSYENDDEMGMETDKNSNKTQKVHFSFSTFRMSTGKLVYKTQKTCRVKR